MKYIKTYNESIKDFLQPKSKEDVLDSIQNLSNAQKLTKAIEYNIDWLIDDTLEKINVNCLPLKRMEYKELTTRNKLNFTDEEKEKIDNILNYNSPTEYYVYKYMDVSINNYLYDCLIIKSKGETAPIWYIDKFDKYITVYNHKISKQNTYLLLPKFDDLLKYISKNKLKAKKIN